MTSKFHVSRLESMNSYTSLGFALKNTLELYKKKKNFTCNLQFIPMVIIKDFERETRGSQSEHNQKIKIVSLGNQF